MSPTFNELSAGQEIGSRTIEVTRTDLVKYAGASGDFNPIHWNEAFATGVELPGVIAHGMFTMAAAVRVVTDWVGDPGAVVEYGVRFTRPVVVPYETGADVEVSGVVKAVDAETGRVTVELTATCAGEKVLGRALAVARLD